MRTRTKFLGFRKSFLVTCLITACVFFLTQCISGNNDGTEKKEKKADNFKQFAGSQVCANCHKDIYEKHLHTEHHLTTAPATEETILGSFASGKNVFAFDPLTNVVMEKRDSGFYQVGYSDEREVRKGKFDIAVGSGRKGQSYLSWVNDKLVQLPMTYYSALDQWTNSPGYSPRQPQFNRPITSRCLECHSTYFEKTSDNTQRWESFDKTKVIFGVECEKCHGPAAMHVEFHQKNKSNEPKFIINPAKLPRQRQLDLCALCHGGALTKTKPSFSFQAGDTLSNYFSLQAAMLNADNIDVHGNQAGLLYLSKCFTAGNLTCTNCHNTHQNEQNKLEVFSQRCMNCHNESHGKTCPMTTTLGASIKQNCIDCHMPKQPSHAIAVFLQGKDVPTIALLRTHYIKVYAEETKKFLNRSNSRQPSARK